MLTTKSRREEIGILDLFFIAIDLSSSFRQFRLQIPGKQRKDGTRTFRYNKHNIYINEDDVEGRVTEGFRQPAAMLLRFVILQGFLAVFATTNVGYILCFHIGLFLS